LRVAPLHFRIHFASLYRGLNVMKGNHIESQFIWYPD
jgi:hypothetical protein